MNIQLAYNALKAKKLRSVLTIIGIGIGIAVVIAIMAAGRGLNYMVLGEMEMFGPNTINIEIKVPSTKQTSSENAMGIAQGISITTLKDRDREDILKHPNISAAYGMLIGQEVMSYAGLSKKIMIAGEGYQMAEVEKFVLESGRMYTEDEEESMAQVIILGNSLKKDFFGDDTAEGKIVRIRNKSFRVIGVAEDRGSVSFMDMDRFAYMPAKTLQKRLMGIDHYTNILAKMIDRSESAYTVADLQAIVRDNHDITDPDKDDFAINTMEEAAEIVKTVIDGIILLLVALVCVSLVVGGVGIMNIMYVSVSERVFEIGLRKALGATKKDIMWQFLIEAIMLTIAGSIIGIIIGVFMAFIIYWAATNNNIAWVYSIPISSIVLSISFSAVIGLIFGLYPARKASRYDPIVALRKE